MSKGVIENKKIEIKSYLREKIKNNQCLILPIT